MRLVVESLATLAMALTFSYLLTPHVASYMLNRGVYGRDAHKPGRPVVPESVGLSYVVSTLLTLAVVSMATGEYQLKTAVYVCSSAYIALIGLYDDLKTLTAPVKVLLTLAGILPVLVLGIYVPHPYLPFIGRARVTIIYAILLPLVIGVTANAANMMDTYNGSLVLTSSLLLLSLYISGLIGYYNGYIDGFGALAASALLGALIGFAPYNVYPARAFNGDVGSLFVGSSIGLIAVLGRLEVIALTAMMPYVLNGFYILTSIKGFRERREIKVRPVTFESGAGMLRANLDPNAPVTLAHLLLLRRPMSEQEIVAGMVIMEAVSAALAIVTAFLTFS